MENYKDAMADLLIAYEGNDDKVEYQTGVNNLNDGLGIALPEDWPTWPC